MAPERAIFLGFNALGDTLCSTATIRAYREANPEAHIAYVVQSATYTRVLDHNPHIDFVLYNEHMAMRGLQDFSKEWLYTLPLDFSVPATLYTFDMNQVCTTHEAFQEHIAVGLSKLVKIPIESIRPEVRITPEERALAASFVRRPYAVFSMHSNANPLRENSEVRAKDWPLDRWEKLSAHLRSHGIEDVIAIGAEGDVRTAGVPWRNLYGLPIKLVAALLQDAACVITLENGIGHLCHGVDARMVMIYSNLVPIGWANPAEATNCRVLYNDPQLTTVDEVTAAVDAVLEAAVDRELVGTVR